MAPLDSKKQSEISGEIKISHVPKSQPKPEPALKSPQAASPQPKVAPSLVLAPEPSLPAHLPESEQAMKHERVLEPTAGLLAEKEVRANPAAVVVPGGTNGAVPDASKLFHSRYRPSGPAVPAPVTYQQSYSQNELRSAAMPALGYVPADRGLHDPGRSRKLLVIGFGFLIGFVVIGYVAASVISNRSGSDNFSEIQEVTEEIPAIGPESEAPQEEQPEGSVSPAPTPVPAPADGEAIY